MISAVTCKRKAETTTIARSKARLNLPLLTDKILLRVSRGLRAPRLATHAMWARCSSGKDYDNLGYESLRVELLLKPLDSFGKLHHLPLLPLG